MAKDYLKEKMKATKNAAIEKTKNNLTQPINEEPVEGESTFEKAKRAALKARQRLEKTRAAVQKLNKSMSFFGKIFGKILSFFLTPHGLIILAVIILLFLLSTASTVLGKQEFGSGCVAQTSYVDSGQTDNFCEMMGNGDKDGRLSDNGGSGSKNTLMNGDYCHPFKEDLFVAQPYGYTPWSTGAGRSLYPDGKHTGVDITPVSLRSVHSSHHDVEIFSITDGVVEASGGDSFGGNWVIIKTDMGGYLYYGHNKTISPLKKGDKVKKCDSLKTYVGNSGTAANTVAHIHLEYVSPAGGPQFGTGKYDEDPSKLFKKDGTLKQDEVIKGK